MNTRSFHLIKKWRKGKGELNRMKIHDTQCEDPRVIKERVKVYFKDKFKEKVACGIKLGNIQLKSITQLENKKLLEKFFKEEVKVSLGVVAGRLVLVVLLLLKNDAKEGLSLTLRLKSLQEKP